MKMNSKDSRVNTVKKVKFSLIQKTLAIALISLLGTTTSAQAITDTTPPVITAIADADILPADVATWTAPTATANDDVDLDISADVTVVYSSTDAGSAVTDLASARTHLGTVGNTVTVTYSVLDTAGNPATDEVAVFTAIADPADTTPPVIAIADVAAGNAGSATYANAAVVIAALPATATANTSAVTVPVTTWVDTDTYNPSVAGSYTFTATLGALPTGWANTGAFTATVEVVVEAAVVITPPSTPSTGGGLSFADEEKIRLANEKAAADKLAAEKAAADRVAAEKLAEEKLLAERIAVEKALAVEAAAKAAEELKAAEAAEAVAALAVAKASKNSGRVISTVKSTRISLDLADKYEGTIAFVELVTKVNSKTKVTVLDYFVITTENATATSTVKKLKKGQRIQVRIDGTIVFRATI
jgi:hypothetical protein